MGHFDGLAVSSDKLIFSKMNSRDIRDMRQKLQSSKVALVLIAKDKPLTPLLTGCKVETLGTFSAPLGTRNPFNNSQRTFRLIKVLDGWRCAAANN